jgi:hypothetical protein
MATSDRFSSLALPLDYPKMRSLPDPTGNRTRAISLEIDLQALDHSHPILPTLSRGSRGSLGQNPVTSQHPLSMRFQECDRFL